MHSDGFVVLEIELVFVWRNEPPAAPECWWFQAVFFPNEMRQMERDKEIRGKMLEVLCHEILVQESSLTVSFSWSIQVTNIDIVHMFAAFCPTLR